MISENASKVYSVAPGLSLRPVTSLRGGDDDRFVGDLVSSISLGHATAG